MTKCITDVEKKGKRAYHVHQTAPKEAFEMDLSPKALTDQVKKTQIKRHNDDIKHHLTDTIS